MFIEKARNFKSTLETAIQVGELHISVHSFSLHLNEKLQIDIHVEWLDLCYFKSILMIELSKQSSAHTVYCEAKKRQSR